MKKLTLSALGFVIAYNFLFFQTDNGIGSGLFFLILNLFYFLFKKSDSKNISLAIFCSAVSTVFGFFIGFRANEIVAFINLLTAVFFSACALYFYKSPSIFSFEIPQFLLIPLVTVSNSITSFFNLFSPKETYLVGRKDKTYSSVIRGVVITLPLLLILLVLLTKADPIFSKLVSNLFNDIWERLLVSIIVFLGLVASGGALIQKIKEEEQGTTLETRNKAYELLIILGGVTFLFISFLIVQFNYFFSNLGERELQILGIASLTYSEYVRKGFFELLAASSIAVFIMFYVMKFLHVLPLPQKLWTQLLSIILTLEIGLLLISAGQRINLYQLAHGLTRARVFGFIFLVWLGFMLIVFLVRIIREVKKETLFMVLIAPTLGALLFLNIVNIDGLIATKYKPSVNGEVDYFYLVNLSEDANGSWEQAINDSKTTLIKLEPSKKFSSEEYRQLYWARATLERLDNVVKYLNEKYGDYSEIKIENEEARKSINKIRKWQSFNLGEYQAYIRVLQNKAIYNQVSDLLQKANDFNSLRVEDVVRKTAPLDRATQPPLL